MPWCQDRLIIIAHCTAVKKAEEQSNQRTLSYNEVLQRAVKWSAMQCSAMQCSAMQYSAMQWWWYNHCALLPEAHVGKWPGSVNYSTVQYSTVQYSTVQYSTVQTTFLAGKASLARLFALHIVPHKKFDRIVGTSSSTFPNFKYGGPREICVERSCFDSPIAKWELEQIFDDDKSSRAVP